MGSDGIGWDGMRSDGICSPPHTQVLRHIMLARLKKNAFGITKEAENAAVQLLALKRRCDGNFANAAAAELLVDDAIKRRMSRAAAEAEKAIAAGGPTPPPVEYVLRPEDISEPLVPRDKVFDGLVGIGHVRQQLDQVCVQAGSP